MKYSLYMIFVYEWKNCYEIELVTKIVKMEKKYILIICYKSLLVRTVETQSKIGPTKVICTSVKKWCVYGLVNKKSIVYYNLLIWN